jgi:DNA-directed RNA polymerase subunit RPC12/RpoP
VKFACPRCGKRYSSADEPVQGRVYAIACRCGHTIVVKAPERPPGEAVAPPATDALAEVPAFSTEARIEERPPAQGEPEPPAAPTPPAPALPDTGEEAARAVETGRFTLVPELLGEEEEEAAATLSGERALAPLPPAAAPPALGPARRRRFGVGIAAAALLAVAGAALFLGGSERAPGPAAPGMPAAEPPTPPPSPAGSATAAPNPSTAPTPNTTLNTTANTTATPTTTPTPDRALAATSRQALAPAPREPPRSPDAAPAPTEADPSRPGPLSARQGAAPESPADRAPGAAAVEAAVNQSQAAFVACVEESLRSEPHLKAAGRRVGLSLTVNQSGTVTATRLDDPDLAGSALGACLEAVGRKLVLPGYQGEPLEARVPLMLGRAP